MKLQKKKIIGAAATLTLALGILGGCGGETVTVTFQNGDALLGTAEAAAGKPLSPESYRGYEEGEDATFAGWFETPTLLASSEKDLTTATFTEDTTLYGKFEIENGTEDTRQWYIAGTSATGPLSENNWAGSLSEEEKAAFELKPTGSFNEFSLTIDLYAGDEFQIIPDWNWDGQKGYGLFTELDDTQFENGGGLSGNDDTSNVDVLMDGNYTITLVTFPDHPAQDTVTVVRNSDPTA